MSNHFNFKSVALFFSVIILIASCNNDHKENDKTTNNAVSTNSADDAVAKKRMASGILDTLWVEAAIFDTLKDARLFLSFAVVGDDTLTLYGWSCKNSGGNCTGEFNDHPSLKLKKGGESEVGYGPFVFWDNLILLKKEIGMIKQKIHTGTNLYQYVLFVPKNTNGHISYSIIVSDNEQTKAATATRADLPTDVDANPSPPKNTSN